MPIPAMGGWFGPSNYEECILENMKGVASDKAVREIKRACRVKFPYKPAKKRNIPRKDLKDITGKAWFIDKAHPDASRKYNFYASLYNNNAKWIISQVKIRITDKATGTHEDVLGGVDVVSSNLSTRPPRPSPRPSKPSPGRQLTLWDLDENEWLNSEEVREEKQIGFIKRRVLSPSERKNFAFSAQKVPAEWEWNIIGAEGYRKP
jgi:hypothetical protein